MPTIEERLVIVERQVKIALATTSAFQGQPADATLSIPHNDSWLFEDNVDATHAANLRYIISKNVTRVVSARLSMHLAPYRTYNSFSATVTGGESAGHTHGQGTGFSSTDTWTIQGVAYAAASLDTDNGGHVGNSAGGAGGTTIGTNGHSHAQGTTFGVSNDHTHSLSLAGALGVTEGATATGIKLLFDGADQTAALGGPFNADVIELDVRRFIGVTQGVYHTLAMQPTGLGRIEAHLRLGVYVSAGQAG